MITTDLLDRGRTKQTVRSTNKGTASPKQLASLARKPDETSKRKQPEGGDANENEPKKRKQLEGWDVDENKRKERESGKLKYDSKALKEYDEDYNNKMGVINDKIKTAKKEIKNLESEKLDLYELDEGEYKYASIMSSINNAVLGTDCFGLLTLYELDDFKLRIKKDCYDEAEIEIINQIHEDIGDNDSDDDNIECISYLTEIEYKGIELGVCYKKGEVSIADIELQYNPRGMPDNIKEIAEELDECDQTMLGDMIKDGSFIKEDGKDICYLKAIEKQFKFENEITTQLVAISCALACYFAEKKPEDIEKEVHHFRLEIEKGVIDEPRSPTF